MGLIIQRSACTFRLKQVSHFLGEAGSLDDKTWGLSSNDPRAPLGSSKSLIFSVKRVRSRSSHRSKETLRPSRPSSNCPVQNRASSPPRDDGSSIATASIQQA